MLGVETLPDDTVRVDSFFKVIGFVVNIGHAARHTCAEVVANFAEDNGGAACHIFTAICAAAFDNRNSARVANGKAFTCAARRHEAAFGCAVKTCIADNSAAVMFNRRAALRRDDNLCAG